MISKIKDESLDIEIIYEVLETIKLEFEIEEDLFVKKKLLYIFIIYIIFMMIIYMMIIKFYIIFFNIKLF